MTTAAPRKRKSLLRRAFGNQYNYILLGAAGLFALATFSWVPVIVGAGIEALWLVLGADTPFFRRWVDKQERAEDRKRIEEEARAALDSLDPSYRLRFEEAAQQAERVREMAAANASLEAGLIESEMAKLGEVLQSFLRMAVLHQRLDAYLREADEDEILRDGARFERELGREKDPEVRQSLRESFAVAEKRARQHAKVVATHKVLTLKMETLEKSLKYLESQIVGMGRREELASEIDEIVMGVEAVDEITAETDGLLRDTDRTRAAHAGASRTTK